ncbi:UDP-N-acetylmuramate:L-alanyl-gamma-D-glutamyl-meso-diaminopimelate ligase [Methylomonas rhizoryzae]|uniref:UDP-N-acetylmuramate:L-alanyl-gamma-D-glutamyl- meso-diaminopimelate ligase n=1 Tax=Methylomonas rhizoryzae TaxID=2608981 RepID=UPI001232253C|nr:UDP-N-acetylmuramate:L-alanyl-gamma-D-glutamyl-meso-diaminopimelate ligase [Methylomonas rhizoryzae]
MTANDQSRLHIHIIGICGTFMGGLALIARELGYQVSGSDQNVYPPMSTQLEQQGIALMRGYRAENLDGAPDIVVIGNALSRGNPEVEAVLNRDLNYLSGPQWLAEHVLRHKWVLAVAGTHGKTTTTSMLSWILEYNGLKPGFLVGGIPVNFGVSARLGESDFFVIEADEYDCAFFDKRSKFVHYRPRTAVLNNLEYDHADIFEDLDAIKKQFHHLIRTIPGSGLIVAPAAEQHISDVLSMGCWTPVTRTAIGSESEWQADLLRSDGSAFTVCFQGKQQGEVSWNLTGLHNVSNALSAIAAARHVGIAPSDAVPALAQFKNVKRRMEVIIRKNGVTVYDDFAHHPTAIKTTLDGLRKQVGSEKIVAIVEPRSNTMRLGIHTQSLAESLTAADTAIVFQPDNLGWDLSCLKQYNDKIIFHNTLDDIIAVVKAETNKPCHVLLMSNGSFGGIYRRLQQEL